MRTPNPILVEITRGNATESCHRGSAVVITAGGEVAAAWGDTGRPILPRSAAKPLQALPLIETGAAEHFRVTDQEIALACASHSGEPVHTRLISAWLLRLGLECGDLVCGPHPPLNKDAATALVRVGQKPCPIHNNCSGKHAGFLTTALHMGESTKSYAEADSPVQRRVMELLSDMGECDLSSASRGTDGCGIPVIAMPLEAIALAMARLGKPEKLSKARSAAATRIIASMTDYPHLVAGKARFATETMEKNPSSFVIKGGAEGVYAASIPPLGLGLAVKIDDGAKRAAETAMATLISRFSAANGQVCIGLEPYLERRIYNAAGDPVGVIRAADEWMH